MGEPGLVVVGIKIGGALKLPTCPVVGPSTGTQCRCVAMHTSGGCRRWTMVGVVIGCGNKVLCCQLALFAQC